MQKKMEYKRDNAIREITKESELEDVIKRAKVCYIGFLDDDKPYVLGFNYGYKNKTIYLHCAKQGKKLDIIKKNNQVCMYFNVDNEIFARHENVACSWRQRYRSVQAYGKAEIIDDYDRKLEGLKIFMQNYSEKKFTFNKPSVDNIYIIEIKLDKITGRKFEIL
ncbi:MAG: pyridoxamine 5'-phosphate oxidase family protein [Marinilabiliales bacterium]